MAWALPQIMKNWNEILTSVEGKLEQYYTFPVLLQMGSSRGFLDNSSSDGLNIW